MKQPISRQHKTSRGFTLIELLISLVVLAIGLLGLAGLQATALRNNNSAYMRTQANLFAYDIIDRMRANFGVADTYDIALAANPPGGVTNCQLSAATCTQAQMMAFDQAQWKCSLGNFDTHATCTGLGITGILPEGDGGIVENGDGTFTITIRWKDRRDNTTVDFVVDAEI